MTRATRAPMNESDARTELVQRFFDGTGSTYDGMVNWATLGFDRRWKKRMLAHIPSGNGPVLDLACGTGISTFSIARQFPGRFVIGVELREEYLSIAREKAVRAQAENVQFVLCRAEEYQSELTFDCVTSSYLAKYADLAELVPRCDRLLRRGGVLMMHDFTLPPRATLRALWHLYFMIMRNTTARAFPQWSEIYRGLPKLIERTRWLPELEQALTRNGFVQVEVHHLTLYGSAIVTAVKP